MASLTLTDIRKSFGPTQVLRGVSIDVRDGEFLTLLGPSGCGKSTLLRIIAGIEGADSGTVAIGARDVGGLRPRDRDVAMVFQSYALYPYMTVRENIALPLTMRRLNGWRRIPLLGGLIPGTGAIRRGIEAELVATAGPLGLGALLDRKPAQLSGGQRQRVALARAMVRQPAAFLMDEPLSNLDARLRGDARAEIAELHRRLGATFIYVTHDQAEAMTMSDRVAVLDQGRLVQLDTPRRLYDQPADLAVARFIGSPRMSLLAASVDRAGRVLVDGVAVGIAIASGANQVTLGVRAEGLVPARDGFAATVRLVEQMGPEALVHLSVAGAAEPAIMRLDPDHGAALRPGDAIRVAVLPGRAFVFGADGARLGVLAEEHAIAAA